MCNTITRSLKDPSALRPRHATAGRLLDALESVVAALGAEGATTTAVAAAAGVATGTFYTHFADRDAALAAALDRRLGELVTMTDDALSAEALLDRGLEACMDDAVGGVLAAYAQHAPLLRAALGRVPGSEVVREVYWRRHAESVEAIDRFLRRGAAAGMVRKVADRTPLVLAVLVLVEGLNHPALLAADSHRDATRAEVVRALVAMLAPA